MNENTEIILQHCDKPVYVCVCVSRARSERGRSQCFERFPLVYPPLLVKTRHTPQTWTEMRWEIRNFDVRHKRSCYFLLCV